MLAMGKAMQQQAVLVRFRNPETLEKLRLIASYYGKPMTRLAEDWLTEKVDENTAEVAEKLRQLAHALRGRTEVGGTIDEVVVQYAKAESQPDPIQARRAIARAGTASGASTRRHGRRSPFAGLEPGERQLG